MSWTEERIERLKKISWLRMDKGLNPAAIRESLQALIHDRVSIKLVPRKIQVSGDVALVSNVATVVGATPDGSSVTTHTTEVLRRQPDGRWTYVIDDPFFASPDPRGRRRVQRPP